jgi:hypothetical protein
MNAPAMTWALAGKMTVWVILIIIGYALLVIGIGKWMEWLGRKYPRVYATQKEYYGVEPYGEPGDYSDAVGGTEPPRAA